MKAPASSRARVASGIGAPTKTWHWPGYRDSATSRPARAKPRIEAQSAARPASDTVIDRDADRVREDR